MVIRGHDRVLQHCPPCDFGSPVGVVRSNGPSRFQVLHRRAY